MAMLRTILRNLRPLACAALAFAAAAPLSAQTSPSLVPSRIVQTVDDSTRVTLHGYIHPLASKANDRGVAPDSMPLQRLHLVLKRSTGQEATLQSLVAGMHTPGNANYHKWLSPSQFGQQFGPSDQDVATVESWLSAHGFEVTGVKAGKQEIEFNGSVAQLRNAFGAQIHKYVLQDGSTHYATATEPSIPAALAPVVSGFVSLNNFRLQKYARVLGQATYNTTTHQAKPNWTYGQSTYVVSPDDFGVEYDLPNKQLNASYAGTAYDGTGQTVAIINDSNINLDLVQQFRSIFLGSSYASNVPTVVIDGNDPGVDGINNPDGPNYDSGEAYIDVEWSGAVAPNANIDLVIAADTYLEG
jgi:trimeric autotransporter adhesin